MKQTIETLKSYFETGDKPTESQFSDLIDSLAMPMVGEIKTVGFATVPDGWAKCDGQLLNISDYGILFSLLGTTYGGDGITTFALPDLRDKVMVHKSETKDLGQNGGTEQNTLSESQLPSHSHDVGSLAASHTLSGTVRAKEDEGFSDEASGNDFVSGIPKSYTDTPTDMGLMATGNVVISGNISLSGSTATAGSAIPVNNMQPYLVINTIIALEGINPLAS
ncbi:phage tail protein [Kordia sp.]|uniref:phage tail protein n=1 Tax=Kordia sp. TaxID=1965332 RepID=UPI003D271FAA